MSLPLPLRLLLVRLLLVRLLLVVAGLGLAAAPASASFFAFETGHVRPLAASPDGSRLFAVNTPDNRLEVFAIGPTGALTREASVPVGLEPTAVAARSGGEVWVVNHLSDSISIVDVAASPPRVVRTLLTCDEPRDLVFAGPGGNRAFVTTARRGQSCPVPFDYTTEGIGRAVVQVFDANALGAGIGGTPIANLVLFGDTPRALAVTEDGATVYAAVFHSGNQTAAVNEAMVCNGGAGAGTCAGDGVTSPNGLASGRLPGGLPAPNTNADLEAAPEVSLVVKFDEGSGQWRDELGRNWSNGIRFHLPDRDVFAIDASATPPVEIDDFTHVGTILFDMIVNPANDKIYVTNTDARNEVRFEGPGVFSGLFGGSTVRGHLHEARISVIDGAGVVTPRHLNKHLTALPDGYQTSPIPPEAEDASLATPIGMAITSDGAELYVAAFGSSAIGVFSTAELESGSFVPDGDDHIAVTGGGPTGLVLDETHDRLYVLTRFDNAVKVIDTGSRSEIASHPLYNPEPEEVVGGRQFLYDARLTSSNGEASCSSCHVFGDFDGLGWDLGNPDDVVVENPNPFGPVFTFQDIHPMKGPMTTQTLRGMRNHGPMHWRGDRSGAFEEPNVEPDGGGFNEDLAFKAFNVAFEGLLGREEGELTDDQMQSFTDFILAVMPPPNPIRNLDNSLTASQQAGESFYFNVTSDVVATCNGCHEVDASQGFFGTNGESTFENETQELKVAHLRNAYQKVGMFGSPTLAPFLLVTNNGFLGDQVRGFGFLHDGSIDTVFHFLRATVFTGFSGGAPGDVQRRQVEDFTMAFDTDFAPIVGQQVTLTSGNGATVGPRINLLLQRASTPFVLKDVPDANECDLVVRGTTAGEARGWLWNPDAARFRSDRASEPLLTDAQLRALAATPGQSLTYTCAPPSSGERVALDRDEDGFFDRDEIDDGSDPADPASSPVDLIPASRFQLLDDGTHLVNLSRPRLVFDSRTDEDALAPIVAPTVGEAGDPTAGAGGSLVIYNADGSGQQVTLPLPAEHWRRAGKASSPRFEYRTSKPHEGPITRVSVRAGRITIRGRGPGLYELGGTPQGAIALRLTLGVAPPWCTVTSAVAPATKNDTPFRFEGEESEVPPPLCPPLP